MANNIIIVIKKGYEDLVDLLSLEPAEAVGPLLNGEMADPRAGDLTLGGEIKEYRSRQFQLRRTLGQLSLGLEFDQWQKGQEAIKVSRVDLLKENLELFLRSDHLDKFLESHRWLPENDNATKRGVRMGIKHLVFWHWFGHKGISALLAATHSYFQNLPFVGFPQLLQVLRARENQRYMRLAEKKTMWLQQCLDLYEGEPILLLWEQYSYLQSAASAA